MAFARRGILLPAQRRAQRAASPALHLSHTRLTRPLQPATRIYPAEAAALRSAAPALSAPSSLVTTGPALPNRTPDTPSERASNERQDIACNAHSAHNAHRQNRRSDAFPRQFKDRDALHMMRHRKDVRIPSTMKRAGHTPSLARRSALAGTGASYERHGRASADGPPSRPRLGHLSRVLRDRPPSRHSAKGRRQGNPGPHRQGAV